jgi:hypothetical protein
MVEARLGRTEQDNGSALEGALIVWDNDEPVPAVEKPSQVEKTS